MTSNNPLKGWVSFWSTDAGEHLLSDSYPTKAQCAARYKTAPITGFIDLSKVPAEAITMATED